jgi:hypothetical protein
MKKLLILLLIFSSCEICKRQGKVCRVKKTSVENITYTYDSTVWKVLPMTKADSIWIDSVSNLSSNK